MPRRATQHQQAGAFRDALDDRALEALLPGAGATVALCILLMLVLLMV